MTDPTDRHETRDAAREPRFDVGDHHSGRTRLLSRQCATCIFRPGNPMHLTPGRLHQLVTDTLRETSYIVCHQTLPGISGALPGICRGFADRYDTQALQIIRRLVGFTDIAPPDEPDRLTAQPAHTTSPRCSSSGLSHDAVRTGAGAAAEDARRHRSVDHHFALA